MSWPVCSLASFLGGFSAGVVNNPIDLVYNRQAADALLPNHLKKGYTSFFDALTKCHVEGTLMRGAVASGVASGVLLASMSNFYDFLKEYAYWFFGPTSWLRPLVLILLTVPGFSFASLTDGSAVIDLKVIHIACWDMG